MSNQSRKVILLSENGYSEKHDALLKSLIDEKILLFCAVGKDCQLWEDIMDELFIGEGEERDFDIITTSHPNETLEEVITFAEIFEFEGIDNHEIKIIEL